MSAKGKRAADCQKHAHIGEGRDGLKPGTELQNFSGRLGIELGGRTRLALLESRDGRLY